MPSPGISNREEYRIHSERVFSDPFAVRIRIRERAVREVGPERIVGRRSPRVPKGVGVTIGIQGLQPAVLSRQDRSFRSGRWPPVWQCRADRLAEFVMTTHKRKGLGHALGFNPRPAKLQQSETTMDTDKHRSMRQSGIVPNDTQGMRF